MGFLHELPLRMAKLRNCDCAGFLRRLLRPEIARVSCVSSFCGLQSAGGYDGFLSRLFTAWETNQARNEITEHR